jgi:hypothetical protein
MVRLKSFSAVLVFIVFSTLPCFSENTWATRNGYYIDSRGSVQDSYIQPPHPENIPARSKAIKPIADFGDYYKMNAEGYRGREDKLPLVPGYTENFSTRKDQLYPKDVYVNVWCDGEKHVGKVDCLTDEYAISFFPLSSWTRGVTTAAWRAKKLSQQGVAAFYVEDMASHSDDMYEAKRWAKKWGARVMFISVDAGIPEEWIP